ncbi:MAG: hypothetical protein HYX92_07930 [Chloroflexi bacterium]|nr:hypothetical protein [Chloroflexota bacterium]
MTSGRISDRITVKGYYDAVELYYAKGWTDGLPIVPPTEDRVAEFLEYADVEPDHVVGEIPERAVYVRAEKVAINAVMAGCLPHHMPVLISAIEAVCEPEFHVNFLASISSPWVLTILSGPIVKEMGFNCGLYLMGPGNRNNATVGRAVSLIFWNCFQAKPGGVMMGCLGHPCRYSFCVADNPDSVWGPLHVERGFPVDANCVTVFGGFIPRAQRLSGKTPEAVLNYLTEAISVDWFSRGAYVVIVPPYYSSIMHEAGWSRRKIEEHLIENCGASVAELKWRGTKWGRLRSVYVGNPIPADFGDQHRFVPLFKSSEYDDVAFAPGELQRKPEIIIVNGGAEAGQYVAHVTPYSQSTEPVTKEIRLRK